MTSKQFLAARNATAAPTLANRGREQTTCAGTALPPAATTMDEYTMLAAGPLLALRADIEADINQLKALAPTSDSILALTRTRERLDARIAEAAKASPTCDTYKAAAVLECSTRMVTKLCESGAIKAKQPNGPRGHWVIDLRSVYDYKHGRTAEPAPDAPNPEQPAA